jgi:Lar family restriction alleviation protein
MSDDLRNRVALLPCPFCGGEKMLTTTNEFGGYCLTCDNCEAVGPPSEYDPEQMREAWNTRADAALAEIGAVRVRPLVWEDYPINGEPVLSMAVTPSGTYFICDDTDDFTGLYCEFISCKGATWYGTVNPFTAVICDHQHVDDLATLKAAANEHNRARILAAIEPAPVSVREAAQAERERCMRIVSAARSGDIDTDMRTLLHFIESGDTMQYSEERSQYEHDSRRRDYELLRAIAEGKDDE